MNTKYNAYLREAKAKGGSVASLPKEQRLLALYGRIKEIAADRAAKEKSYAALTRGCGTPVKIPVASVNLTTSGANEVAASRRNSFCRVHGDACTHAVWYKCPQALKKSGVVCRKCNAKALHITSFCPGDETREKVALTHDAFR